MRCISLWQPWATPCVLPSDSDPSVPIKGYETRSWRTAYRGPLAVHASLTTECLRDAARPPFAGLWAPLGYESLGDIPRGCIVGVVDIVAVWLCGHTWMREVAAGSREPDMLSDGRPFPEGRALLMGDYSPGRYAWELRNPRRLSEPLPFRGYQGLRSLDPPDVAEVMRRLA